jgi:hypothetical protein
VRSEPYMYMYMYMPCHDLLIFDWKTRVHVFDSKDPQPTTLIWKRKRGMDGTTLVVI